MLGIIKQDISTHMPKPKIDKQVHHIYDNLFRQNVYYILSPDQKELVKIAKERLNIDLKERDHTEGRFLTAEKSGCMVGIIWTSNRNSWIIAHEVTHATCWILDNKGIPLTFETEEVYCYMNQFLFREIWEYLQRRFK